MKDFLNRGGMWVAVQLVIFAAIAIVPRVAPPAGKLPAWAFPIGVVLAAFGMIQIVVAMFNLGRSLTPYPAPADGSELKTHGIYHFVRHPIYGGLIILSFGYCLEWRNAILMFLPLLLAGFFTLKARKEEAWLVQRYPHYSAYRLRTKRFIAFLF